MKAPTTYEICAHCGTDYPSGFGIPHGGRSYCSPTCVDLVKAFEDENTDVMVQTPPEGEAKALTFYHVVPGRWDGETITPHFDQATGDFRAVHLYLGKGEAIAHRARHGGQLLRVEVPAPAWAMRLVWIEPVPFAHVAATKLPRHWVEVV